MKLLTAEEVLQALKKGKKVEYKLFPDEDWGKLTIDYGISVLLKDDVQFRLIQETNIIGDISFPKPIDFKPNFHTKYYTPFPNYDKLFYWYIWVDDFEDNRALQRGLIHLTQENAIAHAKAIIKLSGGSCE